MRQAHCYACIRTRPREAGRSGPVCACVRTCMRARVSHARQNKCGHDSLPTCSSGRHWIGPGKTCVCSERRVLLARVDASKPAAELRARACCVHGWAEALGVASVALVTPERSMQRVGRCECPARRCLDWRWAQRVAAQSQSRRSLRSRTTLAQSRTPHSAVGTPH